MEDSFLTVAEIAELLKLNQQTVQNWIDRGELPAVRVGPRRVRIRQSDLDRFLTTGATATLDADERSVHLESPGADPWERLRAAMAESSAALAEENRAALVRALNSLADAARSLADTLG